MNRKVRWVVPELNPRRASLRYRCLYPMEVMQQWGRDIGIYDDAETIDSDSTLIFDAWMMFPSVSSASTSERLLALAKEAHSRGARVIVDNCDNQFSATSVPEGWDAGLARLTALSTYAHAMVCCSTELARMLRERLGDGPRFVVIDDPIETSIKYPGDNVLKQWLSPAKHKARIKALSFGLRLRARSIRNGRTPLVWFGSHGNQFSPGGMLDLLPLRETLESVNERFPISLTIISNHPSKFEQNFRGWGFPVEYMDWDRINFLQLLRQHAISIIPATLNAFTRCKSSNRLTLSVHHGLATVVAPIPSYQAFSDVVRIEDWQANLLDLLASAADRREEVRRAQRRIRQSNSVEQIATDWDRLLFT